MCVPQRHHTTFHPSTSCVTYACALRPHSITFFFSSDPLPFMRSLAVWATNDDTPITQTATTTTTKSHHKTHTCYGSTRRAGGISATISNQKPPPPPRPPLVTQGLCALKPAPKTIRHGHTKLNCSALSTMADGRQFWLNGPQPTTIEKRRPVEAWNARALCEQKSTLCSMRKYTLTLWTLKMVGRILTVLRSTGGRVFNENITNICACVNTRPYMRVFYYVAYPEQSPLKVDINICI